MHRHDWTFAHTRTTFRHVVNTHTSFHWLAVTDALGFVVVFRQPSQSIFLLQICLLTFIRGCNSEVECSLRMREARGSNPRSSKIFFFSRHNTFSTEFMSNQQEFTILIDFFFFFLCFLFISVVYFRDSLLITVILIVNTILVQGMLSFSTQIPNWIQKTTTYMGSNRVGQLFLTKHLVTSVIIHVKTLFLRYIQFQSIFFWQNFGVQLGENEDDINLVESQENEKDIAKSSTKLWRTFGNLIDRILFASLSIAYFIMTLSLLPEKYFDEIDVNSSVSIVGYWFWN